MFVEKAQEYFQKQVDAALEKFTSPVPAKSEEGETKEPKPIDESVVAEKTFEYIKSSLSRIAYKPFEYIVARPRTLQ